ncbi:unnamed protein product [Mucor hiemalis]
MPSLQLQTDDKLIPVSFALKSMNELRDWTPNSTETYNISSVALQPRVKNPLKPRLLLTHDMAGGYKEDKLIQGNDFSNIYNVQYWHLTDTFVFSHERVSIPPVNWTNACHRNGVKCLGTFLVEGNSQMQMEALLMDHHCMTRVTTTHLDYGALIMQTNWPRIINLTDIEFLVAIAKHYGFDGWLFNIECEFFPFPTSPKLKAEELAKFLHYFKEKMHDEIPGSQVIWYDSMTNDGEIDWQNNLNWKNELFFKNSDGIFLNYWWKKEYPEMSRRVAESIGRSGLDVYFGTDVWGRHTYGGGGFKSYKAVKTASAAMTSSALFGMAWTYEHFDNIEFEKMDRLFWCGGEYSEYPPSSPKIADKDNMESDDSEDELLHGYRKGICDAKESYPAPGTNWFVTTFDRGFGSRFYYRGKKLLSQPWSHLSHQAVLPNQSYRTPELYPADQNVKFTSSLDSDHGAFLGGTSLVIKGQRFGHRESRDAETEVTVPLYQLSLDASGGCSLRYIYRTLWMKDVKITVSCHFSVSADDPNLFFNLWKPVENFFFEHDDGVRATVTTENTLESRCFLLRTTEEVSGENEWISKTIDIPAVPEGDVLHITRVEVSVTVDTASLVGIGNHVIASLGYLSIIPTGKESGPLKTIQDICWRDEKWLNVKNNTQEETHRFYGTLNWTSTVDVVNEWDKIDYYNILYQDGDDTVNCVFLGTAFCNQFRLSGLDLVKPKLSKIVIEAVNKEGYVSSRASIDLAIPEIPL